ncbi:MAG: electron transfer flavoprotein subunit beta/FixA family protein [Rhodothermales bacterium]|nr:electron transfer flavoprotein subunit beta/FixA family protein [Rhodothermales bacterium]
MKFCVCIKQVPDVAANVQTGRTVLNAYDASAVEEALVIRDEIGGEVDLVLIGDAGATETIRKALAMGADSAVHIVTDAEPDSHAASKLLADFFADRGYDVILTGKQAQDTDAGLTGSMLAERLGLPFATNAVGLKAESGALVVTRQGDTGQELIHLPAPCLVTCSNDMNDPRIPSLKGIMSAKRKTIESVHPDVVPASAVAVGEHRDPPGREPGVKLEGEVPDMIAELVSRLSDEAGVI